MKKQASLVIIRMWSANYIERTKEILSWDIPMTYTVYHIRNGTVSIISFSHQNIEERHSMSQGGLMWQLCEWKHVNIIEAEVCVDHVHMLVEIPPKMSVSGFVGYLKGKSSQMIFERWANARFKYRNRSFWCRGYYVDSVGKNSKAIGEYIRNQLKEDHIAEQLELELEDPFTGKRK